MLSATAAKLPPLLGVASTPSGRWSLTAPPRRFTIAQGHRLVQNSWYIAMAKLGRNELCPCGSGKKLRERTGSRMEIGRHEYIAARVVLRGPSGGPEIEAGLLHIPGLAKDSLVAQLREHRARFLEEHRGASIQEFYKNLPPFFHDVWVGSFLDPYVPTPKTTSGEDMIPTGARTLTGLVVAPADGDVDGQWTAAVRRRVSPR